MNRVELLRLASQLRRAADDTERRADALTRARRPVPRWPGNPPNRWDHEHDLPADVATLLADTHRRLGWAPHGAAHGLTVACPACHRPPGEPCGTFPWRGGLAHVERQELAARQAVARPPVTPT